MQEDLILFNNLEEITKQAEKLGLQKIIIAKSFKSKEEIKKLKDTLKNSHSGLEIKICHLMQNADNKELDSFVNVADFICMLGDSLKNVSFAASNKKFDFILLQLEKNMPMSIDKETLMNAKTNNTAILLPISSILNANSFNKAAILQKYSAAIKLCKKIGCDFSIISGAQSKEEMRNKKDLDETIALFMEKT